jgi:hypothetical protein
MNIFLNTAGRKRFGERVCQRKDAIYSGESLEFWHNGQRVFWVKEFYTYF